MYLFELIKYNTIILKSFQQYLIFHVFFLS